MSNAPAPPARALHPALARPQLGIWIALAMSLLICVLIAVMHFQQRNVLQHTVAAVDAIRQARIDLSQGFVAASRGTDPALPYDREGGLALLQQAMSTIEHVAFAAGLPSDAARNFQAVAQRFRTQMVQWPAQPTPRAEVDLRIAFHELDRAADRVDVETREQLQVLLQDQQSLFIGVLAGAALLLAGICAAVITAARVQRVSAARMLVVEQARQAADQALERSEGRLRDTFEHAGVGIAHIALDGRFLRVNQKLADIVGYTQEELQSRTFQDITHEQDLPVDLALGQEAQAGRFASYSGEKRYIRKDGSLVWVTRTTTVVRDASGAPDYYLAVVEDISARKEMEAALRANEQRLRLAMRASNQSFFEVDLRTRRAMLSSEHLRMLGHLAREEMVPYEQLRDRRHPDDVERLDRMYDEYAAGTRASHDEELRLLTASGDWIWVRSHGQVSEWNEQGRAVRVVGTSTDITARKHTEAALVAERALLRTLLDTLPDIVFVKDREARYVLCNAAATQHCGLVSESDMIGRTVFDLYPEDMARLYHADDMHTLAGESILNREEPGIDDAGRPAWFLTIKVPLRDGAGTITGMLGVSRDITEHKRAEELIRRTQKMEALGTLAGGIAHDFNNILLAINGNARLAIADLPEGHPALESLGEISRAGARAADLVRRILAFSRPQEVRRDVVDLRLVVEEAVKLLRPTLPAMIELDCRFAPEAPAVTGDASQIHQVIMNLVTNAAHAIGERVGHIGIAVDNVQLGEDAMTIAGDLPDGRYARLSVTDDGSGMDALTQERIFDPFLTTKPAGQGTGLGLSVVHGILRAHEGSITVYSQPGKGTTFHCYLPAATGPAGPVESARLENVHGRGERVLYVDDEAALVQLAKRSLQRLGYRVVAFDDPIGALHEFRARPEDYDLVITDLSMPGMSGFELAREILARRPEMPVIMTSGYVRPQDEETARLLGIRAVVLKPGTVEELGTMLRELLGDRVH